MKKTLLLSSIGFALTLSSCVKTPTDDILPNTPTSYQKADDATAKNEFDYINDEIERVYKSDDYVNSSEGARVNNSNAVVLPCGKVTLKAKDFKLEYNENTCGSKVKSGSIDVKLIKGNKFSDSAAALEVTFNNYKVYYNASKTSVTYNGKQTITNVSGGKFIDLIKADTLIHSVRGDINVSFDSTGLESKTRNWNVFHRKTFTSNGTSTGLTFTLDGDTTIDGLKHSEIGINKEGHPFVNVVETPLHWENCGSDFQGPYILKTGIVKHTATNKTLLLGTWTGNFSMFAGYSTASGVLEYKGNCESAGYKLTLSIKKDGVIIGKESEWFQEY